MICRDFHDCVSVSICHVLCGGQTTSQHYFETAEARDNAIKSRCSLNSASIIRATMVDIDKAKKPHNAIKLLQWVCTTQISLISQTTSQLSVGPCLADFALGLCLYL